MKFKGKKKFFFLFGYFLFPTFLSHFLKNHLDYFFFFCVCLGLGTATTLCQFQVSKSVWVSSVSVSYSWREFPLLPSFRDGRKRRLPINKFWRVKNI